MPAPPPESEPAMVSRRGGCERLCGVPYISTDGTIRARADQPRRHRPPPRRSMIPELFHIGKLSISPFGVMMALSFVAAYFQLRWGVRKLGVGDDDDASALVLAGAVAGIVGAKIYYVLLY